MLVFSTQKEISDFIVQEKSSGASVGFVPTMGALHRGHRSLIDHGLTICDIIVVSIFVNPTQFNNSQDLDKYPRNLDADINFLNDYGKQVVIYAPSPNEVYDGNIVSKSYNFGILEEVMEGEHRPGHFDGVATVLNLLFRQVNPDKAFFGEKDFQQLVIVRELVKKERLSIEIVGCPIHRQEDGLAMSSRNERLTAQQLEIAPFINEKLVQVQHLFDTKSAFWLKNYIKEEFAAQDGLELEYFEIANTKNLSPLSRKRKNQTYRAFLAVYAGDVRLIDNIAVN